MQFGSPCKRLKPRCQRCRRGSRPAQGRNRQPQGVEQSKVSWQNLVVKVLEHSCRAT